MSSESPKIFLLGTGYIGGSLLLKLLDSFAPAPKITCLIRKDEYIKTLEGLHVDYVKGSLDDHDVIAKAASEHEVIIHAATADDEPSVKAVLDGISQRAEKGLPTNYIHTSGTGELQNHSREFEPLEDIYSDEDPAAIDALPDSSDHRNVDLIILAKKRELKGKAKIAIIMPPCIFGVGSGPFNNLSQQVIALETGALRAGVVPVPHDGEHTWSYVHNADLMEGYVTILKHLLSIKADDPDLDNPYYFCESFEQTWKATGDDIAKIMGLSTARATKGNGLINEMLPNMSAASRSRAKRLRKLGWSPKRDHKDFLEEIKKELKILEEKGVKTMSR